MKYAWIENKIIRDLTEYDPFTVFCSDVAEKYNTEVPDNAAAGDTFNGTLTKRVITVVQHVEVPAVPPVVSVIQYKMLFTVQERILAKNSTDEIVKDLQELMNDPRTNTVDLSLKSIQDALDHMTTLGILASGRKEEILTGIVK